jgi:hypothetical protein
VSILLENQNERFERFKGNIWKSLCQEKIAQNAFFIWNCLNSSYIWQKQGWNNDGKYSIF